MAGQLRDQRHRALHILQDQLVDPLHLVVDQMQQSVQRVRLFVPLGVEIDDDRHANPFRRRFRRAVSLCPTAFFPAARDAGPFWEVLEPDATSKHNGGDQERNGNNRPS
jgi:hypothetical protein